MRRRSGRSAGAACRERRGGSTRERHARHYPRPVPLARNRPCGRTPSRWTEARVRGCTGGRHRAGALAWFSGARPVAASRMVGALHEYWFRFGYFPRDGRGSSGLLATAHRCRRGSPRVLDTSGGLAYQQAISPRRRRGCRGRGASTGRLERPLGTLTLGGGPTWRGAAEPEREAELPRRRGGWRGDRNPRSRPREADLGGVPSHRRYQDAEALLRESVRRHRQMPDRSARRWRPCFLEARVGAARCERRPHPTGTRWRRSLRRRTGPTSRAAWRGSLARWQRPTPGGRRACSAGRPRCGRGSGIRSMARTRSGWTARWRRPGSACRSLTSSRRGPPAALAWATSPRKRRRRRARGGDRESRRTTRFGSGARCSAAMVAGLTGTRKSRRALSIIAGGATHIGHIYTKPGVSFAGRGGGRRDRRGWPEKTGGNRPFFVAYPV